MLSSDIEAFKAMAVKRQMEWLTDKQEERHEGEILTSLTAGLADVIWTASRRTTDKRPRKNENASSACNHPYPFQLCSRRRREGGRSWDEKSAFPATVSQCYVGNDGPFPSAQALQVQLAVLLPGETNRRARADFISAH